MEQSHVAARLDAAALPKQFLSDSTDDDFYQAVLESVRQQIAAEVHHFKKLAVGELRNAPNLLDADPRNLIQPFSRHQGYRSRALVCTAVDRNDAEDELSIRA